MFESVVVPDSWRATVRSIVEALPVEVPYLIRIVVAAAVSWQLSVWLGATQPPVYAVIVPLVAMRDAPYSTFNVSIARVIGVVAGIAVGIGVLHILAPGTLTLALVLAVALAIGIVLRVGGALNIQVAVSALLVFANPNPSSYAVERLWETAVGAGVTILLAPVLLPTNPFRSLVREHGDLTTTLARSLLAAGNLVGASAPQAGTESGPLEQLRRLAAESRPVETRARSLSTQLSATRKAIRVHPLWRKRYRGELARLEPAVSAISEVATQLRLYLDDLAELASRPDAQPWWQTAGPTTRDITAPLSKALAARLAGHDDDGSLQLAQTALQHQADNDTNRLGTVARRPLRRTAAILAGL
jgi:uncharacterized membrane protein YgaE (UPF0421/DUF939 family)